ncbi:RICIN domain-containing protein [Hymenobacter daeguensis]
MKKQAYASAVALLLLLLARFGASAQAIGSSFFGINDWYSGTLGAGGTIPGAPLSDDLTKADLRWMRIGGHKYDSDPAWKTASAYVSGISFARSIGAEPIVQIPITLTKDELSTFVAYFSSNNIAVTYFAIGNEPDPSDNSATSYNETTDWSNDVAAHPNEFGYTYSTWVSQYKTLAIRLKNDRPGCKLVGPDFRLFYNTVINDYYLKFINNVGSSYWNGVPLLDYFTFHFYGDQPESVMQSRVSLVAGLLANVNANGRATNGSAAPLRMGLTEVNTFTKSPAGDLKPWDFGAGQFVATMAKLMMQQSALCVIPWSIYEGSANHGDFDQSLYDTEGSASVAPARRSTMWHLALLSNYRQDNLMNGTQSGEADHVVVLGMRGPAGYTVVLMNTQSATSYSYRASLDNVPRGPETVQVALQGYAGITRQLAGTIAPQSTHLYHLDASGNVLAQLVYTAGDAAPKQQLSFNFVNRSTGGYARPLAGGATANITQYTGTDHTPSSLQWLLKPAAPGYYYLVNQYTGNAMRPAGTTAAAQLQEDQVMTQEALGAGSLARTYLHWSVEYTGSGGYYRLKNRGSGKYLRPLNGAATADINLTQHTYDAALTSEQWRFDQTSASNAPAQARGALAVAADASAQELRVYPNPATTVLNLSLATDATQATLRDMVGRVCRTQAIAGRSAQLAMQDLPAGVYVLTVQTAQGEIRRKVVKE